MSEKPVLANSLLTPHLHNSRRVAASWLPFLAVRVKRTKYKYFGTETRDAAFAGTMREHAIFGRSKLDTGRVLSWLAELRLRHTCLAKDS